MSLYPDAPAVPSTTLVPEVGETIACFDDYEATLEAAYTVTLAAPDYATTVDQPTYASSIIEFTYSSAITAAYASTLDAAAYQTTLEATLDLDVTC